MFDEAHLSDDKFLSGRLMLLQPRQGYRAATDPVFLAAACDARAGQSVLDMGCGVGAAALCLGTRVAGLRLEGIEVQADYAELARRNAARNGFGMQVHHGDLTAMPPALRHDFDHVIANPPYYPPFGTPSPVHGRARAMQQSVPLTIWAEVAARRVLPGGWLTLICGADGLPDVLTGMGRKMGSVAVLPLTARQGRAPARIIIQARKGGRGPFRLLPPLVLHLGDTHDGDRESYTPQTSAVLRSGASLAAYFR